MEGGKNGWRGGEVKMHVKFAVHIKLTIIINSNASKKTVHIKLRIIIIINSNASKKTVRIKLRIIITSNASK